MRWWSRAAVLAMLVPGPARAGSVHFPDTLRVFAPADRPAEILLTTNFGFVTSEDGGHAWTWSCEQEVDQSTVYLQGPAPRHRLFALADALTYSDDGGCTWQASMVTAIASASTLLSIDATGGDRALAIASIPIGDGGNNFAVLGSSDGGATFDTVLYLGAGAYVDSAARAPTDARTIYLTTYDGLAGPPTLTRSVDGGATWQTVDLSSAIGPGTLRIVAVDSTRADRVYLQHLTRTDRGFVIASDGGATATRPLSLFNDGAVAFLRTSDGSLLVSAFTFYSSLLFRSGDDGATFAPVAGAPHIHDMVERDGVVYAATSWVYDSFAEATSTDRGATWQPGMSLTQVQAIDACAQATCRESCRFWALGEGAWPEAVCSASAPPRDAGADAADAADAADVAPDTTSSEDAAVAAPGAHVGLAPRSGCGCVVGSDAGRGGWGLCAVALALLARRRRRPLQ